VFSFICFLWLIGAGLLIYIPTQIRKRPVWRAKDTCASCGYSREGLARQMRCPECGADPTVKAESGRRLSPQGKLAFFLPLAAAGLLALSMAVHGPAAVLIGLYVLIPMSVVAMVLMQIERHVSPAGMAGYALAATVAPAALLGWVSHMVALYPDAQAAIGVFFAWIYAIGAAGIGLGAGWLVERWVGAAPR
jgi:predicted RNA-binding Zn-ribbon protein involved in translation (DUF1610 family)